MKDKIEIIMQIENQIEKGLWDFEVKEHLDEALKIYQQAETELLDLNILPQDPDYSEQQRVLSYCLMRLGNILRQLGKPAEAAAYSERELAAARASGDQITLARSLMSNGTNLIVSGSLETGLQQLEEARRLFEMGKSHDHQQGLGWYWILQADLANAGMLKKEPAEVVEIAGRALEVLEPIENWPGVARAYAARAKAHERLGNEGAAREDRRQQEACEKRV